MNPWFTYTLPSSKGYFPFFLYSINPSFEGNQTELQARHRNSNPGISPKCQVMVEASTRSRDLPWSPQRSQYRRAESRSQATPPDAQIPLVRSCCCLLLLLGFSPEIGESAIGVVVVANPSDGEVGWFLLDVFPGAAKKTDNINS